MALTAHGAGTSRHDLAVDAQAAHLIGVAVWGGGLFGLVIIRGARQRVWPRRCAATPRWLAGASPWSRSLAVAGRGDPPGPARSTVVDYGALLGLKVLAAHCPRSVRSAAPATGAGRARVHRRARRSRRLVVVEAAVMAAAAGTAVALNRTPPPGRRASRLR